jgi:hypothetical protein
MLVEFDLLLALAEIELYTYLNMRPEAEAATRFSKLIHHSASDGQHQHRQSSETLSLVTKLTPTC